MAMVRLLHYNTALDRGTPCGTTETIVPRRGNRRPVRYVQVVAPEYDYEEEELPKEHDPLTKRGWRRVVVRKFHPRYGGYSLVLRSVQYGFLCGFKQLIDASAERKA